MAQLTFGSDVCSELVNAIQTIVDIFSSKLISNDMISVSKYIKMTYLNICIY